MGSGALSVQESIQKASAEEIAAAYKELSAEDQAKIEEALAGGPGGASKSACAACPGPVDGSSVTVVAKDTVSVTVKRLSGDIAHGPMQLSGSTTILELKGLFDKGVEKELVHEGTIAKDDDVLSAFGVDDIILTTCFMPEHHVRAREATRLVGQVERRYIQELARMAKPTDMIILSYLGCYLALAATYGDDLGSEPWCNLGADSFPIAAERQDLTYFVNMKEWKLQLRPLMPWPDFVKCGYHSKVFELLAKLDHFQLEQALKNGGGAAAELLQLLALPCYTSGTARKASAAAEMLVKWLEVSVKPSL